MAGPYDFVPSVTFDWLGQLPADMEGARVRSARRTALADLNSSDIDSLKAKSAALLRGGDFEGGLKLLEEARKLEETKLRGQAAIEYKGYIDPLLEAAKKAAQPAAATTDEQPFTLNFPGGGATPAAPAAGPSPFANRPGSLQSIIPAAPPGPRSEVPPEVVPPSPAVPPNMAELSGGAGTPEMGTPVKTVSFRKPEPPPVQLAGPMPTPDVVPPPPAMIGAPGPVMAQAGGSPPVDLGRYPDWVGRAITGGGDVPIDPGKLAPLGGPPAPTTGPAIDYSPQLRAAAGNAQAISDIMARMGKNPGRGQLALAQSLLQRALEEKKLPPDVVQYNLDLSQRMRMGEGFISYRNWKAEDKLSPETYKEVLKAYSGDEKGAGGYRTNGMKAQDLEETLTQMEAIMKAPGFVAGTGAKELVQAAGFWGTLKKGAEAVGVDPSYIKALDDTITPLKGAARAVALAQAFNALSNQAIYAKLGSLGNQISEGDRNFIHMAFPSLSLSVEGNQLITELMRMSTRKIVDAWKAAEEYRHATPAGRQSVTGMDRHVRNNTDENSVFTRIGPDGQPMRNPDGSFVLTDKGEAMQRRIDAIVGKQPPPVDIPGTARAVGGAVSGAVQNLTGPGTMPAPAGPSDVPGAPRPPIGATRTANPPGW